MSDNRMILLGEVLAQGGWTMLPLYLCSVIAFAVFIRKLIEYRSAKLSDINWQADVLKLIRSGKFDAVHGVCNHTPHPAARVVNATVQAMKERPDHAEAEARRVANLELQKLEKNLTLLSFLAQVAPLLGLLGTVLGMVDLFIGLQGSRHGSIDLSELSSGIWKALVTTAAGLTIAVPTLAAHSYLTSRVDSVRAQLSDIIQCMMYVAPQEQNEINEVIDGT